MLNNTFSQVDELSVINNSQLLNDPFIYGFNNEQDELSPSNPYFSKYDFNTYLMNTQEKSKEIENIDKQSEGKVSIEITLTKISEVNTKRRKYN